MKIRLSQLYCVLSQPKLQVYFKILFSLIFFNRSNHNFIFYVLFLAKYTYLPTGENEGNIYLCFCFKHFVN